MADEAFSDETQQSSEMEQSSPGPVFPPDVDERLIGACHVECVRVKRAIAALKAAQSELKTAVTAWGDCRAAAAANVSRKAMAAQGLQDFTTDLAALNSVINSFEDSSQIWIDSNVCELPAEQSQTNEETSAP